MKPFLSGLVHTHKKALHSLTSTGCAFVQVAKMGVDVGGGRILLCFEGCIERHLVSMQRKGGPVFVLLQCMQMPRPQIKFLLGMMLMKVVLLPVQISLLLKASNNLFYYTLHAC